MPELSLSEIELVTRDIRRQDINFSHLFDELVDHVCCDIENEMDNGLSFRDAYLKVKQRIGNGCFSKIQKETLFAVDSKYRFMKSTMKISGIAGTILFGVAALLKIQHWPGAGIAMTLGAITLALIFLPSSLGVLWKETHNRSRLFLFISVFMTGFLFIAGTLFKVQHWPLAGIILLLTVASTVLMLLPSLLIIILRNEDDRRKRTIFVLAAAGALFYILGMLFKIQHWPFATLLSVTGIIILGFIALPWYSIITWKNEPQIDPKYIFIIIACTAIIVPGALININLQKDYNDGYIYNQKRQVSLYEYLIKNNSGLLTINADSSIVRKSEALHKETMNLIGKIDDIRELMVQQSEKIAGNASALYPGAGSDIMYQSLSSPFEIIPVSDNLMPGCINRTGLENDIRNYILNVKKLFPQDTNPAAILNPSFYLPSVEYQMSLLPALNSLDLLRNTVLAVESGLLRSLHSQTINNF